MALHPPNWHTMSQDPHETINVSDAGIGTDILLPHWSIYTVHTSVRSLDDNQYQPRSTQKQELDVDSEYVDGSEPIFSMYLEIATKEDKEKVKNWKDDADSILTFVRLSSDPVSH